GVGEMPAIAHPDGPVIVRSRRPAMKRPAQTVERGGVLPGAERPLALRVRHEADAVDPVAVMETRRGHAAGAEREIDVERHVDERIAVLRTGERGLEHAPFLDCGRHWFAIP